MFASEGGIGLVGGFIGHLDARTCIPNKITNAYSVGLVTAPLGAPDVGGLIGGRESASTVISSYWDVETSGQSVSDGGEGQTTAEMMMQGTFTGWDFVNVWSITENSSYPYLQAP